MQANDEIKERLEQIRTAVEKLHQLNEHLNYRGTEDRELALKYATVTARLIKELLESLVTIGKEDIEVVPPSSSKQVASEKPYHHSVIEFLHEDVGSAVTSPPLLEKQFATETQAAPVSASLVENRIGTRSRNLHTIDIATKAAFQHILLGGDNEKYTQMVNILETATLYKDAEHAIRKLIAADIEKESRTYKRLQDYIKLHFE